MTALITEPATGTVDVPTGSPAEIRAELVARARALVPVLRERAGRAQEDRRVPDETVADLTAAGLMRAATPARWGGYPGLDCDVALEIAAELARGDVSTAWCYSFWTGHAWIAGATPEKAQEELFADGPDLRASTGSAAIGDDIAITDHGYQVSGTWKFSSGSDHSQWFFLQSSGLPAANFIVRREDVEVIRNWRTIGLRGTGSNDLRVPGAEVPGHRVWSPLDTNLEGGALGWQLHRQPSYRLLMLTLVYQILAPVVGGAQGALETFRERYACGASTPKGPMSTRKPDYVPLQLAYAEAAAEVDTAQTLWRTDLSAILARAAEGRPFSTLERARVRRNQAYAAKLAVRAVNRLFEATGAHALADSDPLQRFYRDVHAGSHHFAIEWDPIIANYGYVDLGMPFAMAGERDGIEPRLMQM